MNRTEKYKEKGVTLIVLVVSIVVLIILSMVSFAMLTGNNGLLKETVSTKQMVDENKIIEHVQSEVLASFNRKGTLDIDKLKEKLNKNLGVEKDGIIVNQDESVYFKFQGVDVTVESNGNVLLGENINPLLNRNNIKIGDYVNYIPEGGEENYKSPVENNGKYNQSFSRESLSWRVLKIGTGRNGLEKGKVRIISSPTQRFLVYNGIRGYNNGVYDLNKLCETLYSHNDVKARSVNITDFEDKYNGGKWEQTRSNSEVYGTTYSPNNKWYPNIYKEEVGATIDEVKGTIGQSTQDKTYEGGSEASSLTTTYTYWKFDINEENFGDSYAVLYSNEFYWLASRSVSYNTIRSESYYVLSYVSDKLDNYWIYDSTNSEHELNCYVRAVIDIPADVEIDTTKSGADVENAYTINWK